jgi:hypothetical protein
MYAVVKGKKELGGEIASFRAQSPMKVKLLLDLI